MNLDSLARWYVWCERLAFGSRLAAARRDALLSASQAERVLLLGDGDGRFSGSLALANPALGIDIVEASPRMVRLARRRIAHASPDARVCWRQCDFFDVELPAAAYGAVVAQFFLDCFSTDQVHAIAQRIHHTLKPGGVLLVAEFQQPPSGWRRVHAAVWLWTMYRFFRWTTGLRVQRLPDYTAALAHSGFALTSARARFASLIVTQIWRRIA